MCQALEGGRPMRGEEGNPRHELGEIPRGIEVLVKKASVDPEFRRALIEKRAEAANEIGLTLDPAEAMMLGNVPQQQLEAIIGRTKVGSRIRPAFLGRAAGVMLAALGIGAVTSEGCATMGVRPDRLPPRAPAEPEKEKGQGSQSEKPGQE